MIPRDCTPPVDVDLLVLSRVHFFHVDAFFGASVFKPQQTRQRTLSKEHACSLYGFERSSVDALSAWRRSSFFACRAGAQTVTSLYFVFRPSSRALAAK
jgi:hypothetical protein